MTSAHEPAMQRRLRRLELTITRRLDGLLTGQHLGLLPGSGSELAGGREYSPGDDVRRMDWAVTARTTIPHVRDTVADRELETWVLVDATASMDFGTADWEKRDLAAAAVAAVGFLTMGGGNRLGAVILSGGGRVDRTPARSGRPHLFGLLRKLLEAPRQAPAALGRRDGPHDWHAGEAPTSLVAGLTDLQRSARRRGLTVVVSDFLDGVSETEATWEAPLRRLKARHHVLAVQVSDPRELELPDVGLVTLVDPETGRKREISTASPRLRRRFAAAAAAQDRVIATGLRRAGVAHLRLRTDRDWVADIARHVLAQRRLTRAGAR
ncbi:hypothetical protein Rhe02_00920 [Rhizocola hellebori]|uniref:DUF58 domain-containing protein n=1 Tax=Rhizocola hellebori TaxID=1392758 RepID=A0A8J3Q1H7_9ACTN|nr:DUF58 domain-containing protein [Rhizocola hellebori]GIH02025.1 hypothetical protein Rhe02_00920 [Rhizocola hellebori]